MLPLAALGMSLHAYAAMPDDASSFLETSNDEIESMTIPAQHDAIRSSFSYLLGQPTYNSGFFNPISASLEPSSAGLGRVRPAFTQSGIAAMLAYDFADGKYVQADWLEFFGNTQSANGPKIGLEPQPDAFNMQGTGRTRSTFIRGGADIGQTFFAGDNLTYRLSFGGQYVRLGITENSLVNGTSMNPLESFQLSLANRKSVLNGLGPRVGLGAEYDICWNVKLVAQTYASLNVGNIKATTSVLDTDDLDLSYVGASDTFRTIIPGLEGSLGIRYDHDLGADQGIVSGEFGYQVIGYFNTFSGLRDGVSTDSASITSPSSFGQNSIYFKLAYNGELLNT